MTPKAKLNLDVDWFYRRPAASLMAWDKRWIEPANEWVGSIYRKFGYRFTLAFAALWSRFDGKVIDGVVDGLAYSVRGAGDQVRRAQTGRIQQYIAFAVAALFAVLAVVVSF